jgi:hypothetical protein
MIQQQPNDPNQPKPPDQIQEQPHQPPPPPEEPFRPPQDRYLMVPRLGPLSRSILVLGCGVGTSMAALLGVFLLNVLADENIMGLYANYVIPAGALLVGLAASSGYAFAAWFSGRKMSGPLLLTIVLLQILAYFGAQYLEYLANVAAGAPNMGFFAYFDMTTQSWAWKDKNGGVGQPLGKLGYLLRFGEIVGFTLGAILPPLALRGLPYCSLCERYMKTRQLAVLPAEAGPVEEMTSLAKARHLDGFADAVKGHQANKKANAKLGRRVTVKLIHCVQCSGGHLQFTLEEGSGQQIKHTQMGDVPLDPEFVRDVVDARPW